VGNVIEEEFDEVREFHLVASGDDHANRSEMILDMDE